jgi:hypothetical protein
MAWTVELAPELDGYGVEWVEPGRMILSRRNRLFESTNINPEPRLLGEVQVPIWQRQAARVRLGQRMMRFMFYNVIPLGDGKYFVTFNRQVGILDRHGFHAVEGMLQRFRVLRGACALGDSGAVYFGEYFYNEKRVPVHVYRCRPDEKRAEIAHTFAAGSVRHVHGVYRDPFSSAIWVATGDHPHESCLWRTDDEFASLQVFGSGDEGWRAVSLQFTRDAVYYATDAEFRQNLVYRVDRATGERTIVGEIDGPVYYSHTVDGEMFFAVTAELCPSQAEMKATLWRVTADEGLEQVYSAAKDLGARKILGPPFMVGTMNFPGGPGAPGGTYFHGVSLKGIDNRTLRLYKK